jgi:hypothetical protein
MSKDLLRFASLTLLGVLVLAAGAQRAVRANDTTAFLGGLVAGAIAYDALRGNDHVACYGYEPYYAPPPVYYVPPAPTYYYVPPATTYYYAPPVTRVWYPSTVVYQPRTYVYRTHDYDRPRPRQGWDGRRAPSHAVYATPPGYRRDGPPRSGKYGPSRPHGW